MHGRAACAEKDGPLPFFVLDPVGGEVVRQFLGKDVPIFRHAAEFRETAMESRHN